MHLLASVVSLGLDSFLACALVGMGSLSLSWRERAYLAFGFGAWDALGSVVGSISPPGIFSPLALGAFVLAALLYVRTAPRGRGLLFGLPVLLSLDNFFSRTPVGMAPLLGVSSGLLALVGLCLGAGCRHLVLAWLSNRSDPAVHHGA